MKYHFITTIPRTWFHPFRRGMDSFRVLSGPPNKLHHVVFQSETNLLAKCSWMDRWLFQWIRRVRKIKIAIKVGYQGTASISLWCPTIKQLFSSFFLWSEWMKTGIHGPDSTELKKSRYVKYLRYLRLWWRDKKWGKKEEVNERIFPFRAGNECVQYPLFGVFRK